MEVIKKEGMPTKAEIQSSLVRCRHALQELQQVVTFQAALLQMYEDQEQEVKRLNRLIEYES